MKEKLILKTNDEIRTMTDPYRIDIVQIFRKNNNIPLTVKDIADALGEPHGKVYYHIKKLEKIGALALDHTKSINGIIAKYYKLDFKELSIENDSDVRREIELNQSLNMVAKFYDDSKNAFIKYIKTMDSEKRNHERKQGEKESFLTCNTLYFTQQSYIKFSEELKELISKYEIETKDENEYKKTIFLSIYSEL